MITTTNRRNSPLKFLIWGYIIWSLVPVVIAVVFSFNDGRSRTVWQGFSLRWWFTDPNASVFQNAEMRNAIVNSLVLAFSTIVLVTPLGIALAIGAQRIRGRSANFVQGLTSTPLITPEIVVGAALLLTFTRLFTAVPLGFVAQLLGNVTFSLASVVVIVRARLVSIGSSFEEAARDLGASRWQAMRFVLVPMLWPSVMASLVVVFATVIDDFVITSFLSAGVSSETVPLRIYSSVRGGASPALNALATLLVLTSFTVLIIGLFGLSAWRKKHGERGGLKAALADVTQIEG
ncbi:MAG: ABC transporter permease [Actinobacteria bacterium]|nr:ABC transporter permease [Actinomycetota bacterium]NDE70731.1 ABC transporter permease [Actinomycetota bacterium]NDF67599.1 ABC transporter permease [Actinomycetota bacterium]